MGTFLTMKHSKTLILSMGILFSCIINAKTYTPAELNQMVKSGNYPAQLPAEKETQTMRFDTCRVSAMKIINDIKAHYPTDIIVDTNLLFTVKAWTNDAAMTITCSSDNKMVITQAGYQ